MYVFETGSGVLKMLKGRMLPAGNLLFAK